jgi:hypothetical protein
MPRRGFEPAREVSQDGNGEENQMQPAAEGRGPKARDSNRMK